MSILVAILALSFLILVHEIGHFSAAKLLKVKVLEFAIFMGPKLFSKKVGETEYSIRLVPMGGFIKMEGEEEESEDDRAFNKKPKWVRAVVLSAGSLMNLFVALILMLIISLNTGYDTCELNVVLPGSPVESAGLKSGDVVLEYNESTVNTPIDVFIHMMDSKGADISVTFLRDGQVNTAAFRPEHIPRNYYMLGIKLKESYGPDWNVIESLTENGPAGAAGIKAEDRVISIDGVMIRSREDLRAALAAKSGEEVSVTVQRAGEYLDINLTPVRSRSEEGYEIGASFVYVRREDAKFFESIKHAYYNSLSGARMVLYSLKWLITGSVGIDQMSGPVGIVSAIGEVVEESSVNIGLMMIQLMSFVALLSINLGLLNLMPFPALDGSKLLLILIEAIRRKKVPPEKEMAISMFGFAVLILLMVVTLFNDIGRLIAR